MPTPDSKPVHILHIEDSAFDRELVRDALEIEDGGFTIDQAGSHAEFEAALERDGFDLVLSDFNILGFEGLQVIEAVHARHPGVPVIMITGTGSEEIAVQSLQRGAADYVIKTPQHIQRLPNTIRAVLEREQQRRENAAAQEEARYTAQKLRNIFENISEGVFQTTPDGRYRSANPALARLYGYESPEDLMAHLNAADLYCDPQRRVQFMEIMQQDGRVVDFEAQVYRRDGTTIWIRENARLTTSETGEPIYEGTIEDITERKRAMAVLSATNADLERRVTERTRELSEANEKLQRELEERKRIEVELRSANKAAETATRAKSEFLSRMSHELRTPLNAILGFGQLMELDELPPEHSESLAQIMRAGQHLLELINEILDISRIEAGRLHIALDVVDAVPVIEDCLSLLRPLAHRSGVQIWRAESEDHISRVYADPRHLKQILLNLLSNAIKYNRPQGTVVISCETVRDAPAPDNGTQDAQVGTQVLRSHKHCTRIKITDTGLGIASEKINELFTPFKRLHMEETTIEGSGLGLVLSRHLAQAMGGSLGVESNPGVGSTFWLDLPQAD